jgi:hypothetical protein
MHSIMADSVFSEATVEVLGDQAASALKNLGAANIAKANNLVLQVLSGFDDEHIEFVQEDSAHEQESVAPDILQPKDGIRFLRLTEGMYDLALPLLSFAVALTRLSTSGELLLELGPATLETARSIWKNVITLRSPQDDDAIAICKGILRHGATRALLERRSQNVSTDELIKETALPAGRVHKALEKLHSLKLIEATWANQSGDIEDSGNLWRVAL